MLYYSWDVGDIIVCGYVEYKVLNRKLDIVFVFLMDFDLVYWRVVV